MQDDLIDLLEEIDKSGKITVGDLKNKGFDSSIELAGKCYDMIRLYRLRDRQITDPLNSDETIIVSPKGFEYLNPIKIKKAIERLDVSIKNFNDSSNKAYTQLNDSITKFNSTSDKTASSLIVLTILLVYLTLIPAISTPQKYFAMAASIIVLVIVVYIIKKK